MLKGLRSLISFLVITCCIQIQAKAQKEVVLTDNLSQHMFTFSEIEMLKDEGGRMRLSDVLKNSDKQRFKINKRSTPQNETINAFYWYKISIDHSNSKNKLFVLEFFDQTIDQIDAYLPNGAG